jgi:class 3 adenylate cyclase
MTGISIRIKAALLLVIITLLPVGLCVTLLLSVNREAVRTTEKQLQAAVLAEVAGGVTRLVRETQGDAEAVAAALGSASSARDDESGMAAVRALIATRPNVAAARFEVPAAKISTVIRRPDETRDAPVSTEALRKVADERGVGFVVDGPGHGVIVVPIVLARRAGAEPPRGYVTVGVDLSRVAQDLENVAQQRFADGGASVVVVDGDRRIIAAHRVAGKAAGADGGALPVFGAMPKGTPWTTRIGVVSEHEDGGVKMVGAVESIAELGWAVAIWRPEPVAYAALARMRTEGVRVAAIAALFALIAGVLAGRSITKPILALVDQARMIGQRRWHDLPPATARGDEVGVLGRSLAAMAGDLEKGEQEIAREARLRGDLGRFLSKELVDAITAGKHELALGGRRASVSVVFADVVGFTPLAETRPAEEVVALLNELFTLLTEVVFRHGGTVDKFVGDCIMAVWGAPVFAEDHAERALAAAEDMMRFLENANDGWKERYGVEIRLGIGVNSGEAIVGNIGSDKRMEYTVIGDVVNVAARLEAIAAPNQVLVSEATEKMSGGRFALRHLGERRLTGRETITQVYELETS